MVETGNGGVGRPKKRGRIRVAGKRIGTVVKAGWRGVKKYDPRLRRYITANFVIVIIAVLLLAFGGDGETLSDIAASLLAAGLTGLVFLVYQTLLYQDDLRSKQLHEVGLEAVFLDRTQAKQEYRRRLTEATKAIDILGFGLRNFREDFVKVDDWWSGLPEVRILLLNPAFPGNGHSYADQRDEEEEHEGDGRITRDVEDFVRYLRRQLGENSRIEKLPLGQWQDEKRGSTLQVKLAECMPAITVFRIDYVAYWGPYMIESASRHSPTFKVRSDRPLFDEIERHFDAIWKNWSTDVPPEWLQPLRNP